MNEDGSSYSRRDVLKRGAIATGAVVLGGTTLSGTAAAGIGDGRVGHYNLNNLHYNVNKGEKTQDHVHDASTEKNHGTWKGGADDPVVSGRVGNAYSFELTDQVELPTGVINADAVQTRAAFVKPMGGDDGPYPRVIHQANALELAWYQPDEEWGVYDGSSWYNFGDAPQGEWGHVGVVWNGIDLIGYDDGTPHVLTQNGGDSSTDHINVGVNPDSGGDKLAGLIDEIRIYDRALSSAEMTDLYEMRD